MTDRSEFMELKFRRCKQILWLFRLKKAKVLVVNVRNGSISEAIRHIVLSGMQVDILDNTFILKDNLEMLLDTHFLIKPEHLGMKVRKWFHLG